jgi:hypothetical protein
VLYPFIQDVSKIFRQDSKVGSSTPKQREKFVPMYVCRHISRYRPTTCWPQSHRFCLCGPLKTLSVFSGNWKRRNTSPWGFFFACQTNLNLPRDLWKCVTVHDQSPWMHWFRRRTFWEFVVNCDLINSMNSAVLKMRTCTANVWSAVTEILHM